MVGLKLEHNVCLLWRQLWRPLRSWHISRSLSVSLLPAEAAPDKLMRS